MKGLKRNKRLIYVSNLLGVEEKEDAYGNPTGEYTEVYSRPEGYPIYVDFENEAAQVEERGLVINGTRTLITSDMNCPITETSRLWIDISPEGKFNYVVRSVSRGLNVIKIIAEHVNP